MTLNPYVGASISLPASGPQERFWLVPSMEEAQRAGVESLGRKKPSNVSYHLGSKNGFPLWVECVEALKIALNSIYV